MENRLFSLPKLDRADVKQPQKKKVLYLITKSNWGGAQRYVYDLATNLDQQRFEPVVLLGGNGTLAEMLHHAGIRVIPLLQLKNSTARKQAWLATREIYSVLRTEKPAVLHLNSSVAGFLGASAGRLALVPTIIFTAHGWAFNDDRPWKERVLIKFFHYLTVLLAHRTIAVSRAIVDQMNWPGAARRMKIINPGRSIGVMYERAEARAKIVDFCPPLSPYLTDPWLVCVAELHPIKRHTILLEAFQILHKSHPSLRLVLIGEGNERTRIETTITRLGLSQQVFLTGAITETARFLKAFDVFVLASKSESYGYVLHEAGLAGVPVVATNIGGIPDIITDQKTGLLVPPDDAKRLASALIEVLTNTQDTKDRSATLQTAMSDRSVQKMTNQTQGLY